MNSSTYKVGLILQLVYEEKYDMRDLSEISRGERGVENKGGSQFF